MRADLEVGDGERPLDEIVIIDHTAELVDADREVGVLHLAGQRVAERCPQPGRAVDVPRVTGIEQRLEERQSLDVIPVEVAQHDCCDRRPFSSSLN